MVKLISMNELSGKVQRKGRATKEVKCGTGSQRIYTKNEEYEVSWRAKETTGVKICFCIHCNPSQMLLKLVINKRNGRESVQITTNIFAEELSGTCYLRPSFICDQCRRAYTIILCVMYLCCLWTFLLAALLITETCRASSIPICSYFLGKCFGS